LIERGFLCNQKRVQNRKGEKRKCQGVVKKGVEKKSLLNGAEIGEALGWCQQREKIDWQEPRKFDCPLVRTIFIVNLIVGWCGRFLFFVVPCQFSQDLGWCQLREKIDWQELLKFDCWLVRMIFNFCCPWSIFTSWRVARKSNFDS